MSTAAQHDAFEILQSLLGKLSFKVDILQRLTEVMCFTIKRVYKFRQPTQTGYCRVPPGLAFLQF